MTTFQIIALAAVAFYVVKNFKSLPVLPKLKARVETKVADYRKDAQEFSIQLRYRGFRRVPQILDAFVLDGDAKTFFGGLREMLGEGPDAVLKELDATFDRVLDSKLGTPEGRAVIKARLDVAEKVAVEVVKVAAPVIVGML
jgi:hypothetical protein